MTYNSSTQTSSLDKAVMGLFAAGAMFVLGYTVVRVSLAQPAAESTAANNDIEVVIPHQGALWADVSTQF